MGVIGLFPETDVLGVSVVAAGKPFFGDVAFLAPVPAKGHLYQMFLDMLYFQILYIILR